MTRHAPRRGCPVCGRIVPVTGTKWPDRGRGFLTEHYMKRVTTGAIVCPGSLTRGGWDA